MGKSMSSAPVETLGPMRMPRRALPRGRRHPRQARLLTRLSSCAARAGTALVWTRPQGKVSLDAMSFMALLGVSSALLGFAMDVAIEKLIWLKREIYAALLSADWDEGTSENEWAWTLARASSWIGFTLILCSLSIAFTKSVANQAAGSGIPEMKYILAGASRSQTAWYLSGRTLIAKVVGLTLALGSGLPLGKEGPFVHISCCVVEAMLRLPGFASMRSSRPLRLQMLAVGCAVGVSTTFGAPVGGVLFSIEVTATYFLVSLYWRCFFAAICGAVVTRMLSSWWHLGKLGIYKVLSSEELSAHPTQLLVYSIIGIASGFMGVLFVKLNSAWTSFRKRHAHRWLFRNRFAWSLLTICLWTMITFPEMPLTGATLRKGQFESVEELFTPGLAGWGLEHTHRPAKISPETWTQSLVPGAASEVASGDVEIAPEPAVPNRLGALLTYIVARFGFLVVGITLPLPCGVFAPCLAIGAGVGRFVGEVMTRFGPEFAGEVLPGGYAVLGAAAMAAGVTRTISSAVLVFELTSGLQHMLPILVAVIMAYIVGQCYSPSIFDSILGIKGLVTMPEFNHFETYAKTAAQMMVVRATLDPPRPPSPRCKLASTIDVARVFRAWKTLIPKRDRQVPRKCRLAPRVYVEMTYAQVSRLLRDALAEDEHFPYVDADETLLGVLQRSDLIAAVKHRTQIWEIQKVAEKSMQGAASRAYGTLNRALTSRGSSAASPAAPTPTQPSNSAKHARLARFEARLEAQPSLPTRPGRHSCADDHQTRRTTTTHSSPSQGAVGRRASCPGRKSFGPGRRASVPEGALMIQLDEINSIHVLAEESLSQTRQWCELSDASMASVAPPADWLDVPVPREVWLRRGLDLAPFTVQAQAPMSLVHFYFSQLTLDCVFVVDMGKFVGIINKADMTSGDL